MDLTDLPLEVSGAVYVIREHMRGLVRGNSSASYVQILYQEIEKLRSDALTLATLTEMKEIAKKI
jgi:hypothetical protein